MIDFLIVGSGIAGICFAETALANGKTVCVVSNSSQNSSVIAAGLYNPVVLKRFTPVWKAEEQLILAASFYEKMQIKLETSFNYNIPIYRRFASVEEQNNWFQAADKPFLDTILSSKLISNPIEHVIAPFGFGEVNETGYLDVAKMIVSYQKFLQVNDSLVTETFDYDGLEINEDSVNYKDIQAKHSVFAEGFGIHSNPYFKDFPLNGTKGELLLIKAPELRLTTIIKSNIFIIPLGNHLFKIGATYNWEDKTNSITEEGKNEIIANLKELITCDFEVISHYAGIRPTVIDRRPLVGSHETYANLHLLNGLGTRGVMLGPYLAKELYESIINKTQLDPEIDLKRVYKKRDKFKK